MNSFVLSEQLLASMSPFISPSLAKHRAHSVFEADIYPSKFMFSAVPETFINIHDYLATHDFCMPWLCSLRIMILRFTHADLRAGQFVLSVLHIYAIISFKNTFP